MACICVNALGVGGKHSVFLTHQDGAVSDTLAHIDYVLTTSNGSLALCWSEKIMGQIPQGPLFTVEP